MVFVRLKMSPKLARRANVAAKITKAVQPVAREVQDNKLTKYLLASCSTDDDNLDDLCMFFKLAALYRCRIHLNNQRCQEAKESVVNCLLDLVAPGTSGRISENLAAKLPADYYFSATSALLSCDVDVHLDIEALRADDLSILMLMLRSPFAKLHASQINMSFQIVLNHQSRLYADDDEGFYEWLRHCDCEGRNVMHYLAGTLNAECLAELQSIVTARQNQRKSSDSFHKFARLLAEFLNEPDNNGDTPLFYTVRNGPRRARDSLNFIDELVSLGASLVHKNNKEQTLLMMALKSNKSYLVRYLIQKCVSVPSVSLDTRCERVVKLVMACDKDNQSSFHYAARANSLECARELALGIVLYGAGHADRDLGTSNFLTSKSQFIAWYSQVREEVLGAMRNGNRKKFKNNWSRQQFVEILDIFQGKFGRASLSHDITHEHTDVRSTSLHASIKAVNEEDDVMYPEQIKYEDRDLYPILAADAVRNIKRDKNAKLGAYCCDCKGICVFGYCPCMNAIDYDAYNENGRCRMLSKVESTKFFFGGTFMFENGSVSPTSLLNDTNKLGRAVVDGEEVDIRANKAMMIVPGSVGKNRRGNFTMGDSEFDADGVISTNPNAPDKRREARTSIILPPLIVECGELCQCARNQCRNRVTQNASRMPRLEVFRSRKCGWGVRTLDPIRPGQYICTMSGLLTRHENIENSMYCMSLIDLLRTDVNGRRVDAQDLPKDENEIERQFNLDSIDYGNIGRFLNHSCSPNCATTAVLHDQHDLRTPKIALFAMKSIHVLTELTWYYSDEYWVEGGDHGPCKCGAMNCRSRTNKNRDNDDDAGGDGSGGGKGTNKGRKTGAPKLPNLPPMSPSAVSDGGTIADGYRAVTIQTPVLSLDELDKCRIQLIHSDEKAVNVANGNEEDGNRVSEDPPATSSNVQHEQESHYLSPTNGKVLRIKDPKVIHVATLVAKLVENSFTTGKPKPSKEYEYDARKEVDKKQKSRRGIKRRWKYVKIDANGNQLGSATDSDVIREE